jgi:hypothetical protein
VTRGVVVRFAGLLAIGWSKSRRPHHRQRWFASRHPVDRRTRMGGGCIPGCIAGTTWSQSAVLLQGLFGVASVTRASGIRVQAGVHSRSGVAEGLGSRSQRRGVRGWRVGSVGGYLVSFHIQRLGAVLLAIATRRLGAASRWGCPASSGVRGCPIAKPRVPRRRLPRALVVGITSHRDMGGGGPGFRYGPR